LAGQLVFAVVPWVRVRVGGDQGLGRD
jgi:hypothetical protein